MGDPAEPLEPDEAPLADVAAAEAHPDHDAPGAGDGHEQAENLEGPEQPDGPEERRYPSTLGGLLYLFMLGGAAAGIVVAWAGDWRAGVRLLALSLLFGAGSRLLVPLHQAGMLRVRHRLVDVALLTAVAAILFVLVGSIPD